VGVYERERWMDFVWTNGARQGYPAWLTETMMDFVLVFDKQLAELLAALELTYLRAKQQEAVQKQAEGTV
jgi:hypothetical protein